MITAQTVFQDASGVRLDAAAVVGADRGLRGPGLGAAVTLVALLRAPSPSPSTAAHPTSTA